MSVRITLTDAEMPPSEQFLAFIEAWLSGVEFDGSDWSTSGQERPRPLGRRLDPEASEQLQQRIADSEAGMRHLGRAYELFVALLIGDIDAVYAVQQRFRFILVVGAPRSGGKYLTKELFRAAAYAPNRVPAVIAHDGFPEAGPWRFDRSGTTWVESIHSMAEYLAMVELFFASADPREGRIIVPKKATKAVYAPGLFQSVLGRDLDGIITVRHPVPACISTYEACGGLPANRRFVARGNIERLAARDLISAGFTGNELADTDYFAAYLRYWEDYHVRLSLSGPRITRHFRVVAYGADRFMDEARSNAHRLASQALDIEKFNVTDRRGRHPEWMALTEAALRRVSNQWARVGMEFPLDEIAECW